MARRKINQAQADKIRKEYEAIIEGRSSKTLDDIQAKFGIARTTIYSLRDRGWDVMARPPRAGGTQQDMVTAEQFKALQDRVELNELALRQLRGLIEGLIANSH